MTARFFKLLKKQPASKQGRFILIESVSAYRLNWLLFQHMSCLIITRSMCQPALNLFTSDSSLPPINTEARYLEAQFWRAFKSVGVNCLTHSIPTFRWKMPCTNSVIGWLLVSSSHWELAMVWHGFYCERARQSS